MSHWVTTEAAEAAARAARDAYGRLVAYLAWRWNDLAAAEDALGDATLKALERWPRDRVPAQPESWLLTVAQREVLQSARHQGGVQRMADDPLVRTPMKLRALLGLDAQRMAAMFLVSPLTMAQRLVRAKQKIAQAGIRFEEPDAADLPLRTHALLEAVYAAHGLAWERLGAPGGEAAKQQRRWFDAATSLRHGMFLTDDLRLRTHFWLKLQTLQTLQAAPVTDTPA